VSDEGDDDAACSKCNSSRQERDWRTFAPGGAQERIEWLIEQPLDLDLGKSIIASLKGSPELEAAR
jgi:hypothetical protein